MTMTATASSADAFYRSAQPLVDQLVTLTRQWRDAAPLDPEAIRAHSEFVWLAIRVDLRLNRSRRGLMTGDPLPVALEAQR